MRHFVFFLLAAAFVVVLSLRIELIFSWHYDLGGVEQDEIYTLQRVLAGYPVYENPESPPFAVTQKTPFYHYLCAAVGKVCSLNPDFPFQVYLLSRLVSLSLCLLTLVLAFFLQRRLLGTPVKEALMACMLIFLCFEEHAFDRPDSLYTFLFLASIGSCLAALHHQKTRWWLWASALCAATLFSKQSGILLPALLFGYLVLWQRAWKLAFLCGLVYTITFGVLLWLFKGESLLVFKANVINGVRNGIDVEGIFHYIYNKSYKKFAILFVTGMFIAGEWLLRRQVQDQMRFLGICLAGTFCFAHLTGLKSGSTPSYFTEFNILALMSAPYYWHQYLLPMGMEKKLAERIRYLTWGFVLVLIPLQTSDKNLRAGSNLPDKSVFDRSEQLRRHLGLKPGEYVLADHPVLKLYLFRNVLLPQSDIAMSLMGNKVYDYQQLSDMLETGKIRYFISQTETIDPMAIMEGKIDFAPYFQFDHSYAGFCIFVPGK